MTDGKVTNKIAVPPTSTRYYISLISAITCCSKTYKFYSNISLG